MCPAALPFTLPRLVPPFLGRGRCCTHGRTRIRVASGGIHLRFHSLVYRRCPFSLAFAPLSRLFLPVSLNRSTASLFLSLRFLIAPADFFRSRDPRTAAGTRVFDFNDVPADCIIRSNHSARGTVENTVQRIGATAFKAIEFYRVHRGPLGCRRRTAESFFRRPKRR